MGRTLRVTFNTHATVTVDLVVPDDVNPLDAEDWAADRAHNIAEEEIDTWSVGTGRAQLDMSLDGIGADTIEQVGKP